MKVGFIGLGHMGAGMAANLLKAGHEVAVYNRTRTRAEPLAAQGAKIASAPSEACGGDAVITMLANDDAVESVVFGDQGILASLAKGAIHISSSTISVTLSERLTKAHAKAGQRFVAAPVFGRPDVAAAGQLYIVAAGEPDALQDAAPLFDAIAQRTPGRKAHLAAESVRAARRARVRRAPRGHHGGNEAALCLGGIGGGDHACRGLGPRRRRRHHHLARPARASGARTRERGVGDPRGGGANSVSKIVLAMAVGGIGFGKVVARGIAAGLAVGALGLTPALLT
jgi:hypothetical protein